MSSSAPPLDSRTAASLRAEVAENLRANVPEWLEVDPVTGQPDQASAALIGIFARFGEITIQRLNQAPDKNFLAFLDLLGVSRLPPQPARVPLTFTLAPGSAGDSVVPAGTQAAAPPAEGEKDSVIFETERELTVVAAALQTLIAIDPERDLIADHGALLGAPPAAALNVFAGDRPNEHVLYIGQRAQLAYPFIKTLTLEFDLHASDIATPDARALVWETWDGAGWSALAATDATDSLRASGTVRFANVAQNPEQVIRGIASRWLRCRLLTPVSPGTTPAAGMVRAGHLPRIDRIRASAQVDRSGLAPDIAFANAQLVDITRPFYPFGDKPKLGDVFYLGSREAFAQPGAAVNIDVTLLNPTGSTSSIPATQASSDLVLKWEAWTSGGWSLLGTTTPAAGSASAGITDGTQAFTKSKNVGFALPPAMAPTTVNGVEGYWVRVQIASGNYGVDARYVSDNAGGFRLEPATFAPPAVNALGLSYQLSTAPIPADAVIAYNRREFEDLGAALARGETVTPFQGFAAQSPALYCAFGLPPTRKNFPNRTLSVYHAVKLFQYGEKETPLHPDLSVQPGAPSTGVIHRFTLSNTETEAVQYDLSVIGNAWPTVVSPPHALLDPGQSAEIIVTVTVPSQSDGSDRGFLQLRASNAPAAIHSVAFETRVGDVASRDRSIRWEYWNGSAWTALAVVDGTERLTHPGVVEFVGPSDIALDEHFGVSGYWVRALFEPGEESSLPRLRALLPNTTLAAQTITLRNEVFGSSDASENQTFRTTHSPILAGQQLEVREPEPPTTEDLAALQTAHGASDVTRAGNGSTNEVWVRWIEVPDFYGSGPQDRHYVLDHLSGEVRFGDSGQGRIPPRGVGNIRMTSYQTGGGVTGNRAAGTIVQLKTTVPYIEKVFNAEPAAGGFDAEAVGKLIARAPRTLRHSGRAVALEDYEDLARLASPEVARAKCVPLRRLQDDPLGSARVPGAVSVIIVPGSADAKPLPSVELLSRTENFLRAQTAATASVAVVGPLYVRVDVALDVALVSVEGASQVEQAIRAQLAAFLHPLTGGRDGAGWDFGREPHLSDLQAVLGGVPGVDHIRSLSLTEHEELAGAKATGRFLVHSGEHRITLTFLGAQ